MRERWIRAASVGAVVAVVVACCARDARAHKLHLFVTVEGKVLRGEAYLSGGARLRNAEVQVRGPGGEKLGLARTDERGIFRFTPTRRCAHTFIADTGDGHRAEFPVAADELPRALAGAAPASSRPAGTLLPGTAPAATAPAGAPAAAEVPDELADVLTDILTRAVRRELAASEQRIGVRDVIAGIGYIFGLAGLWMMWRYRRRPGAN